MSRTKYLYLAKILIIFVIYFATAKFGLSLQAVSRFATLIWIPTGFSLAILLLFGYRYWPAVAFGAFFVNLFNGAPPFVALGIATGNTLEAIVGVYLLRRFIDFRKSFDKLNDILTLILIAAPVSSAISATFGVSSLLLGHVIDSSAYTTTWVPWWIGDLISDLIVAPFLLFWLQKYSITIKPLRILEFLGLLLLALAVGFVVFLGVGGVTTTNFPMRYLVYPLIIWAALRFGQREVAIIMVIYSVLAIWVTMLGFGPYAYKSISDNLLFLQFFMIITSVTSLILSVAISEKRELEERKDDFISMASHELRTPVTSIKIYSQIVNNKLSEKKYIAARKYLGKLDDQIYKLTSLIIDLLDVSRIQSGNLTIKQEPFNINLLVTDTIEALQKTTNDHSLIVKGTIKKEVWGDRERVYQVLVNLLANAIKYSPDGGKIVVQCKDFGYMMKISIRDTGVGIEKAQLQRIFERLYRIPKDRKGRVFNGLGIGLFVCAEIIRMHKGKIWAERNKLKGSTFHFTLPISGDAVLRRKRILSN